MRPCCDPANWVEVPDFGGAFSAFVSGRRPCEVADLQRVAAEPPSAFEQIVGIPLEVWMRIDTTEQLEWVRWARDTRLPPQPIPACGFRDHRTVGGFQQRVGR